MSDLDHVLSMAGGVNALARRLGISSAAVSTWKRVPAARLGAVSRITGIPAAQLRPDLPGFAENQAPFEAAQALGLDPHAIAAVALDRAVRDERARRWQAENAEAFRAKAAWLEKHGMPLARLRQF